MDSNESIATQRKSSFPLISHILQCLFIHFLDIIFDIFIFLEFTFYIEEKKLLIFVKRILSCLNSTLVSLKNCPFFSKNIVQISKQISRNNIIFTFNNLLFITIYYIFLGLKSILRIILTEWKKIRVQVHWSFSRDYNSKILDCNARTILLRNNRLREKFRFS